MKSNPTAAATSEKSNRNVREEQIALPTIICATVRRSTRREGGWVGWVSHPGFNYDDCKILLPNEGVDMNILPHQVLFFCETELRQINGAQTQNRPLLRGVPIGKRSWSQRQDIREAEKIIRGDIEKAITDRALRNKSHQVLEDGKLPFIKAKSRSIKELLRLAMAANYESIQSFMEIVAATKPIAPQGVTIGSSFEQVCGHDCLVMNANNDIIAAATSYAISKGWWIFSCAQNPDKTQWIVAMTTTPQADFTLDAEAAQAELTKIEGVESQRADRKPVTVPRPLPATSKTVAKKPAVARTDLKTVVQGGLGALGALGQDILADTEAPKVPAPAAVTTPVVEAPAAEDQAGMAVAAELLQAPAASGSPMATAMALMVVTQPSVMIPVAAAAMPAAEPEAPAAAAAQSAPAPMIETIVEAPASAAAAAPVVNTDAENDRRIEEWVATMNSEMHGAVFTALLSLNTLGMIKLGEEESSVMESLKDNILSTPNKEMVQSATVVINTQLGERERNILAQTLVAAM